MRAACARREHLATDVGSNTNGLSAAQHSATTVFIALTGRLASRTTKLAVRTRSPMRALACSTSAVRPSITTVSTTAASRSPVSSCTATYVDVLPWLVMTPSQLRPSVPLQCCRNWRPVSSSPTAVTNTGRAPSIRIAAATLRPTPPHAVLTVPGADDLRTSWCARAVRSRRTPPTTSGCGVLGAALACMFACVFACVFGGGLPAMATASSLPRRALLSTSAMLARSAAPSVSWLSAWSTNGVMSAPRMPRASASARACWIARSTPIAASSSGMGTATTAPLVRPSACCALSIAAIWPTSSVAYGARKPERGL
eukprot:Unigene4895_Nuclearia_a/m.14974 Unigene4895_Nuclearia_a/g.14974  ORF Unigene4895_Nuclearia_a/g.14974 Unigene4895_Nuclearia_a/m.14974 type:complete len:313 (-) Unigene4895_Nuclearia_a:629-1567(-)